MITQTVHTLTPWIVCGGLFILIMTALIDRCEER